MKRFFKILLVLGMTFSIINIVLIVSFFNILSKLQIKQKILVLHIGSSTFGKKNSLTRFINFL